MSFKDNSKLDIINQAKAEVLEEDTKAAVKLYKAKLRELQKANQVVGAIEREIKDLELRIEQGDV